mgnify:CR=1 FL=1
MNKDRSAGQIINTITKGGLKALCPCCNQPIDLKDAGLFYLDDFTDDAKNRYKAYQDELKQRRKQLKIDEAKIQSRSRIAAESTNIGKILERLAPALDMFQFSKNDCRAIFDPIDYVIFEGLSEKDRVERILFTEIKSGAARLTPKQKKIKELVENKKVTFDTY